jgi:hypothetical protein
MLEDQLVALIKFDEPSGDAKDAAQDFAPVVLGGTCTRTTGKYGSALQTQQATDQASHGDTWNSKQADPISISAWIYITKLPSAMWGGYPKKIVAKGDGASEGFFLGSLSGDDISFGIIDLAGSPYFASLTLAAGDLDRWVHIHGVHTRTRV